jgi:hypothetical protein
MVSGRASAGNRISYLLSPFKGCLSLSIWAHLFVNAKVVGKLESYPGGPADRQSSSLVDRRPNV